MFEVDQFVADCRAASAADSTHKAICEVLARAMSEPGAVLRGLGEPNRAEIRAERTISSGAAFQAHRTELKPLAQSPFAKGMPCHSDPTLSIRSLTRSIG
jgi:hypothetical protein